MSVLSFPRPVARALAVLAVAAASLLGACSENLDSGSGCPALCPLATDQLRDTVLDPVVLDTTLSGFPAPGVAAPLLVAVAPSPDSLDIRAVVRFDTLPAKYLPPAGGDSVALTRVDSGFLRLKLDTSGTRLPQAATLEAYDVDTTAADDTSATTLAPLFRADRRLGAISFTAAQAIGDSIRVPISNTAIVAKAQASGRLRIGVRLVSSGRASLRILGVRAAASTVDIPTLRFDPATDTTYRPLSVTPSSATPVSDRALGVQYVEQTVVARNPRTAIGSDLVVSGVPGRRGLLRFNVPLRLSDSTDVVRAELELVQRPARYADARDTVQLRTDAILATTAVTDLPRVVDLTTTAFRLDTLALSPADSGRRTISILSLVRAWRSLPAETQRGIIVRGLLEGRQAGELRFFSTEGPAGLRPRLRLSYVPKSTSGLP